MTPETSMTFAADSSLSSTSGPSPGLADFSIPSDAMTPWPPLFCWRPARAHHESLESKITLAIRGKRTKMQQWNKSVTACVKVDLVDDEGFEHRADVLTYDKVGDVVELGRLAIDDDEAGAAALRQQRKAGRRPDHEGGADRQKQIAMKRKVLGALHCGIGHRLAERYGRGLDVAAAARAVGRAAVRGIHALPHPGEFVAFIAIEACGESRIAVQLDHMLRGKSRRLVQVVDVLGDDRGHLAGAVKARQRPVAAARPGIAELVGHGEAPPPRFVARLLARQELVERDRLVLGPQAPGRAEIGDAALGGNAGPGEWDNDPSLVDQVLQPGLGGIEIGCDHVC